MCGGTLAAAPPTDGGGGGPVQPAVGFAEATVYHVVTGETLAGIPVHVVRLDVPERPHPRTPRVFVTDDNGIARLGPLESGDYMAYVSWNNNQSDPAYFSINAVTDYVPRVALFFNPDID